MAKAERTNEPRGIQVFGMLIIVSSLLQMGKLAGDLRWYDQIFSYMPPWGMALRYCFSWLLRFVGLAAGFGMLSHKEIARKALIAIAIFTITTVYWKHPLRGFELHARYLDRQYAVFFLQHGIPRNLFSSLAVQSMITNMVLDVSFNVGLLYYFTRPAVKKWFARENR